MKWKPLERVYAIPLTRFHPPTASCACVSSAEDADRLIVPATSEGRTALCIEAVRHAKQKITDCPILAGCIGLYSLAGRLMDVTEIMYMCYAAPEVVETVLDKATAFLISYCQTFQNAGADGVVIAEPLAGLHSPGLAEKFSCKYFKKIFASVQTDDFGVIYHNCGNAVQNFLSLYSLSFWKRRKHAQRS